MTLTQVEKWNKFNETFDFQTEVFDREEEILSLMRSEESVIENFDKMVQYAKAIVEEKVNIVLPEIPVNLNRRLRSSAGYFRHMGITPINIEINMRMARNVDDEHVLNVLIHEFTHFALCMKGEPFNDGDMNFETILYKLDTVSNYYKSENVFQYYYFTKNKAYQYNIYYGKRNWNKIR